MRIHIVDDCSTDGTAEVIERLSKQYSFITSDRTAEHRDYADAMRHVYSICGESDWVWTFGDDDELLPGAMDYVLRHLRETKEEVQFIHVAELLRYSGKPHAYCGKLFDLCDKFGWIEMTGFITGNIARGALHAKAGKTANWKFYSKNSFVHSCVLLEAGHAEQAQLLDYPAMRPQLLDQSEETVRRWAAGNIPWRYLYVSEALERMYDDGILKRKVSEAFFRYHNYHLWDRHLTFFLADVINQRALWAEEWTVLVKKLANFLADEKAAQRLRDHVDQARMLAILAGLAAQQADAMKEQMMELYEEHNKMPYDYSIAPGRKQRD